MLRRLLVPVLVFFVWAPVAHAWSWPVQGPVLQSFLYDEAHPYAAGQHRGIDIGASATGEQVAAPAAGTISFAGSVPTSGLSLTIQTSDGYSVTLTHLGSTLVTRGATVAEGAVVGTIGPSGTPEVSAPYVHLGIRETSDPNGYLDPMSLLPPAPPPPTDSGTGAGDGSSSQPAAGSGEPASGTGASTTPPTSTTSTGDVATPPVASSGSSSAGSASSSGSSGRPATPSAHVHARPAPVPVQAVQAVRAARPATTATAHRLRMSGHRPEPVRPRATARPTERARNARTSVRSMRPEPQPVERPVARPTTPVDRPSAPDAAPYLPLVLNGGATLVAIAAALPAGLRYARRREAARAAMAAEVLPLRRSPHARRERCAA